LENSSPKEETTRLFFGGISVPRAVDSSPQRRLDSALRNLCKGAVSSSHGNKKSVQECLADEIIKASKNDLSSYAIAKKGDKERVAKSAR
jgi:small subunit ribosomal protein S7